MVQGTAFEPFPVGLLHPHETEPIILVLKGLVWAVTCKESLELLGPCGIWSINANPTHRVEYVEDTEAIEVVSPIRLDNPVGHTISHTFFDQADS
ncbi:MAG: hypothetical protein FJ130_00685 [Deltaproteobacteria bacterium]|nr:hypothetical protein [Deltaproteobacteria bacterium]